jgi:superfamily II DNA or RNA helicase
MTTIRARVSNEIFLATNQVDEHLAQFFQQELTFPNPKLGELLRLGYSIWRVPKKIVCYRKLKSGYYLPIGFGPRLRQFLASRSQTLLLDDYRIQKPITPIKTKITLKPEQAQIQQRLLKNNRCILEARPGFGKTMLGIEVLISRLQKTLIIVHTRALLQQWQKRLTDFCFLQDGDLGIIGEGKWKLGNKITLAMYQTLLSRGTSSLKNEFGFLIVDECHHVPANTFAKIVKDMSAKYCLGLTATPFRKDKLDRLMNFYIGKIISTTTPITSESNTLLPQSKIKTTVIFRPTNLKIPHWENKDFAELGTILINSRSRLNLILADIQQAITQNGKILILSERVAQAETIYHHLLANNPDLKIILITGQQKKQEREQLFTRIKANEFSVLVATGGVVGEGFDWPNADHLFLTFPFSWKGKLIQYVGRLQRSSAGKTQAYVYDYLDVNLGIFRSMQRKRLTGYRELGAIIKA